MMRPCWAGSATTAVVAAAVLCYLLVLGLYRWFPPITVLTGISLLAFAIGAGCAGMAGSLFAGLFGHVEPDQFDFTISLMTLAAVVIGGRWGVAGAILGGLTVALYQYVLVDWLSAFVRAAYAHDGALGLFADYLLSKRTDIYFAAQWMNAGGSATQAQITYVTSPSSGRDQGLLRVGLRHKFLRLSKDR